MSESIPVAGSWQTRAAPGGVRGLGTPFTTRGAAHGLACALVLTIPLVNAVVVPSVGTLSKAVGIPLVGVGLVAVALHGRRRRLGDAHVAMLAFWAWAAASYFWSIRPASSLVQVSTGVELFLMVWLLWEFGEGRARQMSLLRAYVLGAYISLGALLAGAASGSEELRRYTVADSHPNAVSFVITLAIPVACYLAVRDDPGWRRVLWRVFVPLAVVGVLLTGSRSGLVTLGLALLMAPAALHGWSRARRVAAVAGMGTLAVLVLAIGPAAPVERLANFDEEISSGDLNGRVVTWDHSTRIFSQRPLAGSGAGMARHALTDERGWEGGVHNTYLSVTVDLGVVGAVLFVLVIAAAVLPALRQRGLERRFLVVLALTLLVGLLPRHWEYERPTWWIFSVLVGMAAVERSERT